MLSESFIASFSSLNASAPPPSSALKDVGICIYEFQPDSSIRATLKKSSTEPNCLAVTASHIFAAQAGKAVVNVYSRERGNQEATIPFSERIRSVAIAGKDHDGNAILVLGTDGGRLILWEVCTGRQVSTPAAHLQPITCLTVDITNNFILSGSEDGSVHVWSLPDLISFSKPHSSGQGMPASNSPIRSITNHSAAITGIGTGHSSNKSNIAISISKDRTAIVWEYRTGKILRTFLLPGNPLCLTIDPADRAFYVGYDDGSTQLVDFFKNPSIQNILYDASQQATPSQLSASDRWLPPSTDFGTAECLTLSYDGTSLLSGHRGGAVLSWDISKGRFSSTVSSFNYPVTNIHMLPPTGLPKTIQEVAVHNIVKPRYDPALSNTQAPEDSIPIAYSFTAQLTSSAQYDTENEFAAALSHPSFPSDLLFEGLVELHALRTGSQDPSLKQSTSMEIDEKLPSGDVSRLSALEEEIQSLKRQLSVHESTHKSDTVKMIKLQEYISGLEDLNNDLLDKQTRAQKAKLKTQTSKNENALKRREAWFQAEKSGKNGDTVMKAMADDDSEMSECDETSGQD
ncbi:Pre-rRNA-processing protein ipi3 [Ophidiomyces ophidiicola]|nr:Pre-rRNA-processing protein ipi3 [Ophidiomyces ophidiicola]KAI1983254.1 Pre-rRNA-processing protein ipi3 [Ophidiomyces ophidiicola]KAI1990435.1 Pre-rRNA-processing protein ipi3 [Ophidiomyces ophidiicola]KAI1994876.1 Pre-rRNA-processing protein ipi3 [Ophidiomyces ophidiicola]